MRFILLTAFITTTAAFLFAQSPADRRIQNDPSALTLLDQVSAKYHAASSLKVNFSLLLDMPDEEPAVE